LVFVWVLIFGVFSQRNAQIFAKYIVPKQIIDLGSIIRSWNP